MSICWKASDAVLRRPCYWEWLEYPPSQRPYNWGASQLYMAISWSELPYLWISVEINVINPFWNFKWTYYMAIYTASWILCMLERSGSCFIRRFAATVNHTANILLHFIININIYLLSLNPDRVILTQNGAWKDWT